MPEVSVVLSFRNAEKTLDECLDSIERQSLRAFDLIAVDDWRPWRLRRLARGFRTVGIRTERELRILLDGMR
jgi:GT2 family glycosyltransferase